MENDVQAYFEKLNELWDDFVINHNKFIEKSNKAAGARARKSLGSIKKLITSYRKASVDSIK